MSKRLVAFDAVFCNHTPGIDPVRKRYTVEELGDCEVEDAATSDSNTMGDGWYVDDIEEVWV